MERFTMRIRVLVMVLLVGLLARVGLARDELVANGVFKAGDDKWYGIGSDDKKEVSVVDLEGGKKGVKLLRKAAGDVKVSIEQTVKLEPQTIYRFVLRGHGTGKAFMRVRLDSSTDKEFGKLNKPWATGSAPMPAGEGTVSDALFIDSGLKADTAMVSVFLNQPDAGEFVVEEVSLLMMRRSKPSPQEKVVLHLGDSITITSYLPFEQRVESLIAETLKLGSKVRQINYGADGETVKELLAGRYQHVVKENLEKVDVAIIRYGANDQRGGSPADFKKKLAELCDTLEKDYPGVKIVLGTGTYVLGQKGINDKYMPYWQAAKDLAAERKYPLADVYAEFEKLQSDKLCRGKADMHPSSEGVKVIADVVGKAMQEALK